MRALIRPPKTGTKAREALIEAMLVGKGRRINVKVREAIQSDFEYPEGGISCGCPELPAVPRRYYLARPLSEPCHRLDL